MYVISLITAFFCIYLVFIIKLMHCSGNMLYSISNYATCSSSWHAEQLNCNIPQATLLKWLPWKKNVILILPPSITDRSRTSSSKNKNKTNNNNSINHVPLTWLHSSKAQWSWSHSSRSSRKSSDRSSERSSSMRKKECRTSQERRVMSNTHKMNRNGNGSRAAAKCNRYTKEEWGEREREERTTTAQVKQVQMQQAFVRLPD